MTCLAFVATVARDEAWSDNSEAEAVVTEGAFYGPLHVRLSESNGDVESVISFEIVALLIASPSNPIPPSQTELLPTEHSR